MNPARPAPGAFLVHLADIPDHGAVVRDFSAGEARFSLLVARMGDGAAAYENRCPHAGSPLERFDGRVLTLERRYILCAAHAAMFRLEDGACVAGPGDGRGLTQIPVEVIDGAVRLRSLPAA